MNATDILLTPAEAALHADKMAVAQQLDKLRQAARRLRDTGKKKEKSVVSAPTSWLEKVAKYFGEPGTKGASIVKILNLEVFPNDKLTDPVLITVDGRVYPLV